MSAKILQLNCQGSYAVMCDLGRLLESGGSSFALVQEPYTTNGCIRGLPAGMRVFLDLRCNSAVIINDNNVECMIVSVSEWGVCVSVEGAFGRMFLVSAYFKFADPIEPYLTYLDSVLLLESSIPLILGVDANASSPMWFSKVCRHSSGYRNHSRGEVLSEWMLSRCISAVNEPSEWYTFEGPNGVSDIDVTLTNSVALGVFNFSWGIRGGWGISDHNLIEIVITYNRGARRPSEFKRWRTRGVNWDVYGVFLHEMASSVPLHEFRTRSISQQIALIGDWVERVNDTLLARYRRVDRNGVKWWTRDLTVKRRSLRRLRIRFQRARVAGDSDVSQHRDRYRVSLREYKELLVRIKEQEWRDFVHGNRDDPWCMAYKICRGQGRSIDVSGIRQDGTVLTEWRDCVHALLSSFFPRADGEATSPLGEVEDPPALERSEIEYGMMQLRGKKSPGLDGMTGEMCKSIWKVIPEYLEALYGKCLSEGHFPNVWKKARVIVLLKSPDLPRSNPRSYRGISLLPVLGKVLERVMVERLQECENLQICNRQFGFRKGKSVEDAWLYVRGSVEESSSKYVLGLFIDFMGAFDYLCWDRVVERLREGGCREIKLWQSYFSGREACVLGVNQTVGMDVVRGCPQGSICGPFIWNIMMDPLLRQLERLSKCCAYADDLLVLVEGQSRAELEARAGEVMATVRAWGARVGVSVARDKSVIMLLKGRLSRGRPPFVSLEGVGLRYVTEVKYLGIWMRERMNFLVHLEKLRERLLTVVGRVRRLLRNDWGLSRRAVRLMYDGLFVACATYGSAVWGDVVSSVVGCRKILSCQRVILIGCMPVCRTVSTDALQVLMGAPPLDLVVLQTSIAYRIRRGLPLLVTDWTPDVSVRDMSTTEWKAMLKERVQSRWQSRWNQSQNGRVTYQFIHDVAFVEGRLDFGFSLSLGFLLTGHGSLNAFLRKRNLSTTGGCDCGAILEDWAHVLCVCPLYEDIRDLRAMGIMIENGEFNVSSALATSEQTARLNEFACQVFTRRRNR